MQWKLAYAPHSDAAGADLRRISEIEHSGFPCISASVPGNLELDLMKAGTLPDLFFSDNVYESQKLETLHVWYYAVLDIDNSGQYLHFEGIDTFSDIFVNGEFVGETDNMFLSYDLHPHWKQGQNEVVVHIRPAMLQERMFTPPAACFAQKYNYASLYTRKAAYMYGWDIMPRIVSAGIWKPVLLLSEKAEQIREVYVTVSQLNRENKTAVLHFFLNTQLTDSVTQNYAIRVEGICADSSYFAQQQLWSHCAALDIAVQDCHLWWPKNTGLPELYDVTVTLLHNGQPCDVRRFRQGIRTVELIRTLPPKDQLCGEFYFRVNGEKIFILGTNWVPLDAFPSASTGRLPRALALLDESGCNMVRCWGGGVYEDDRFYDFCDTHGILIWQDFMMGCAVYPDDENLSARLEQEAVFQIKRLRNHASLALWAGDNECDEFRMGEKIGIPENNNLTRRLLPRLISLHDYGRSYLPSSPYYDAGAYGNPSAIPEKHLWGPRDFFKSSYYTDTFCRFASEIGYHGFPSPASLRSFLRRPEKIFAGGAIPTAEYLAHATSVESSPNAPYAYRIKLAYDQVVNLFGYTEPKWENFLRQSQISQAEAYKFFIELFRSQKAQRSGIIWWNLLDGWPQISDAVVDYYFTKKLAFSYIQRSQQPVCLMMEEAADVLRLIGVNDMQSSQDIRYAIFAIANGRRMPVCSGQAQITTEVAVPLVSLPAPAERTFYLIEWESDDQMHRNHYVYGLQGMDLSWYLTALHLCQMDVFEGFEN